MSLADCKRSHEQRPPSIQHMQDQIRSTCEDIIHFCFARNRDDLLSGRAISTSKNLSLACLLLQLFLMSFQEHFDYAIWLEEDKYYKGCLISRTIKTIYGDVRYWRHYLVRKGGGGFYLSMLYRTDR